MHTPRIAIILSIILLFVMSLPAQGFKGGDHRPPDAGNKPPESETNNMGGLQIREFQGYLIDCNYGKTGLDDQGRNIIKKPSLITLKHLQSRESIDAGFGLFMLTPGHDYVFFRFDKSGSLKAEDFVLNRCKKKNKIYIQVKGIIDTNTHTISVIALEQTKSTNQSFPERQHQRPGGGDGPPNMPGYGN